MQRLLCLPPGPTADRLRQEISEDLEREAYAHGRELVRQGRAGAALSRLHYEPEQKAFLESQRRMLGK